MFAVNLVTGLGFGLAIDYSLFVVSRYREEPERHGHGREALARTLATAGRTVLFSALTVAAAMASLLVFPQRFLWRVQVLPARPSLSDETQRLVRAVRDAVPDALVGGGAAAFADQQASLRAHAPWALALLAVTTFVLLFAFTGSVVLPLKALLINALTIAAAFGVLVLVFQLGLGEPGLESTQPVLLVATAFGLRRVPAPAARHHASVPSRRCLTRAAPSRAAAAAGPTPGRAPTTPSARPTSAAPRRARRPAARPRRGSRRPRRR